MNNFKKSVLHITFDMAIGGTEQVIRQIITGSKVQYNHIIVCIDGKVGEVGMDLERQGVSVLTLSRKSGFDYQIVKGIKEIINQYGIDILHCHQYTPYSYGVLASIGTRVNLVFTEHGRFFPDSYSWKRRLLNPIFNLFTNHIVAISEATASALVKFEWFPRSSIKVIYNGVKSRDSGEIDESLAKKLGLENTIVYGTVARLDAIKNHSMMLKGFAEIVKGGQSVSLLIVGDGPEREKSELLAKELGISKYVVFAGFQSEPGPYFCLIDVFLLPSLSEGTSMTLIESMSLGKPAVVTSVGGNPEVVVDGETGLLCESNDISGFILALKKMLDNNYRESLGKAAKSRFLSFFYLDEMISKYAKLYK